MKPPVFIKSDQNNIVKRLVKIRTDKAYRKEQCRSLVFGDLRLLSEICFANFTDDKQFTTRREIIVPEALLLPPKVAGKSIIQIPKSKKKYIVDKPAILQKISGLTTVNEENFFIMELKTPPPKPLLQNPMLVKKNLVVINGIQDPSNLGSIIRDCISFDYQHLFILNNTVDLFNDKTIRSSRGALFIPSLLQKHSSSLYYYQQQQQQHQYNQQQYQFYQNGGMNGLKRLQDEDEIEEPRYFDDDYDFSRYNEEGEDDVKGKEEEEEELKENSNDSGSDSGSGSGGLADDREIIDSEQNEDMKYNNNEYKGDYDIENRITYEYGTWKDLNDVLESYSFLPYITDTRGFHLESIRGNHPTEVRKAIILNNESQGPKAAKQNFGIIQPRDVDRTSSGSYNKALYRSFLSQPFKFSVKKCVPLTIPFNSHYSSSLNVASAASIILYSLK